MCLRAARRCIPRTTRSRSLMANLLLVAMSVRVPEPDPMACPEGIQGLYTRSADKTRKAVAVEPIAIFASVWEEWHESKLTVVQPKPGVTSARNPAADSEVQRRGAIERCSLLRLSR